MKRLFTIALAVLIASAAIAPSLSAVLPLRDQWQAACRFLASGDPGRAVVLFREFDHWYGGEEQVQDAQFREGFLRLFGLASLEAGQLQESATLLETWFREFPDADNFRAFLRFQLILLHQSLGANEDADRHRKRFIEEHPELPECALVRWAWAEQAMAGSDFVTARHQLELVREMKALPPSGKTIAGAALAVLLLAEGKSRETMEALDASPEAPGGKVLAFWRGLLAPSLTDQLLKDGDTTAATTAATWLTDPADLREQVAQFREQMNRRLAYHHGMPVRQSLWNNHWQQQLNRLERSLNVNAGRSIQPEQLYELRLRTCLKADEAREAVVLAQAILLSPAEEQSSIRAEAFKTAIEASLKLGAWKKAQAFVAQFRKQHPDDPAMPEILFLSARTAAATSQWQDAIALVESVINAYPGHDAVRSWKMLRAEWLLQAGEPALAREAFRALVSEAPTTWQPFLTLQEGRCLVAMEVFDEALRQFGQVSSLPQASSSLREFALSEMLKLHLKQFAEKAFAEILARYRKEHPEGLNRFMVENMAATIAWQAGDLQKAEELFSAVAVATHPAAGYAREQLSVLYRESHDMVKLRNHALSWIGAILPHEGMLPETPFIDCRHYQEESGEASLPGALLSGLVENIDRLPEAFLQVLMDSWPQYKPSLKTTSTLLEWVEAAAGTAFRDSNWREFAAWQLYASELLEQDNRKDSADAQLIWVIQSVDFRILPEYTAFAVAATAHNYDFPESQEMLQHFLDSFPDSESRPEVLYDMAGLLRKNASYVSAIQHLHLIIRNWPDATCFPDALLQLARWSIEDKAPAVAVEKAEQLLNGATRNPALLAEALLLRAKADFLMANRERAFLGCIRILTLYPEFNDIISETSGLVFSHYKSLPEGELKTTLRSRLQPHYENETIPLES